MSLLTFIDIKEGSQIDAITIDITKENQTLLLLIWGCELENCRNQYIKTKNIKNEELKARNYVLKMMICTLIFPQIYLKFI